MDCEAFTGRLKELRRERGWTQRQLGRRMAREAKNLGRPISPVAKSTISSYETGQRHPDPFYALILCRAFQRGPEDFGLQNVLTPDRIDELTPPAQPGWSALPSPLVPGLSTVAEPLSGLPVDWERMATLLAATRRLDSRTLVDLRTLTDLYGGLRCVMTPRGLLPAVSSHLMVLRNQLLIADTQPARHELATMAGDTAVVAGELWHTMLDYGEAAQAFHFALELADEFNEGLIRATALTSLAALYKNRLHQDEGIPGVSRRPVNLIDAAEAAIGGGSSPHQRLWLYSARAWQHAALNERREAEHDLKLAEAALAQMSGPAEGVFAPWDARYHLVSRARVSQLLGMPGEAVRWYEQIVNGSGQPGPSDLIRLHYVLKMITACVEARQVDKASSLLAEAVETVIASGVVMLLRRVQIVIRAEPILASQPKVKALSERLEDVVTG
jgi:transcriptional regulator with XRE-family HTH domain